MDNTWKNNCQKLSGIKVKSNAQKKKLQEYKVEKVKQLPRYGVVKQQNLKYEDKNLKSNKWKI